MFKWTCLGFALVAFLSLAWLTNDLRTHLQATAATVNDKLPEILEKTRRSSEILAALAEDVKLLRDLAGVSQQARDRSLVRYADSLLDLLEAADALVGLEKKVFGSGLKETLPAKEWLVGARKEALWQSFRCKSKQELLAHLCANLYGSSWWIKAGDAEPQPLEDWFREHHDESRDLPKVK